MKTLLLLRHAKSSHKDTSVDDHERKLNKRGKKEAQRMGKLLVEQGLNPDLLVVSSARRCRTTAEEVIRASGYRGEMRVSGALYDADETKLREVLSGLPAEVQRPLVIAHNPGMERFVESLCGEFHPLSTGALASIELSAEAWSDLGKEAGGTVHRIWQPAELD